MTASKHYTEDKMWLNGWFFLISSARNSLREEDMSNSVRLQNCLREMRNKIPSSRFYLYFVI